MRIAQLAPLAESVPPTLYGGTERIVSFLTEELVRQGHQVTLFASGDSITTATLISIPGFPKALRLQYKTNDAEFQKACKEGNRKLLNIVLDREREFDIIHCHGDVLQWETLVSGLGKEVARKKVVSTMHGRLDLKKFWPTYQKFSFMPIVSISNSQREPPTFPNSGFEMNWKATIYHGLPDHIYPFSAAPGKYLAFVGRISPEKGPHLAIKVAIAANMPLKIGAKIDSADLAYFNDCIKPYLTHPLITVLGEINETQKSELLGNALALIFPIQWPEPFGLVMIEAMSAGTPVIAWRNGSVPEVVKEGVTGVIVDNLEGAVGAVEMVGKLDRREVRREFEGRFGVERMVGEYVGVYEEVVAGG